MSKASEWTRVADVKAFLAAPGKRSVGAHSMRTIKRVPWPCCSRRGLLALRNDATRRALREACVVEE